MTQRVESETELGRRNTRLEQRRSRILEDINGSRPLGEIIEQITEMVSIDLGGALCWCALANGARQGKFPVDGHELRVVRREIPGRAGAALGTFFAAFRSSEEPGAAEAEYEALGMGVQLATLAIETRRLSSDLAHRSEFDLLTDVHNRLSLERFLDKEIATAQEKESIFGLIYVDLDDFKQFNDTYGHRIGDLYLREVSQRMKRQLRSGDTLARLGGDEFAALVPVMRSRADAEEIALRLERCFDAPFSVDGYVLRGAASVGIAIYPENGASADKLLSAADAAMCTVKLAKRRSVESLSGLHLRSGLLPRD
jgi:diguanylate cyclase (GGDEF)-like protein